MSANICVKGRSIKIVVIPTGEQDLDLPAEGQFAASWKVLFGRLTSTSALKKSAILASGTKYPTCAGQPPDLVGVTAMST